MFFFFFFFFFFFQAEDGIRDKLVSGVHTCALPILAIGARQLVVQEALETSLCSRHSISSIAPMTTMASISSLGGTVRTTRGAPPSRCFSSLARLRSEERRIGKECRSRWSPDQ